MNDRDTLRPSFWHLQVAGWVSYFVLIVATFLPMLPPGASPMPLVRIKIVRTAIGFALTCLLRLAYRRVEPGRFGQAAAIALPAAAVLGATWLVLASVVATHFRAPGEALVAWAKAPREALDYALTLLAWSALYFGLKWARDLQAARAGALEARTLAQQAQLEALRYQLNPHFLFNALNSIRALVDEDRARAKHMITALSDFLRYPMLGDRRTTMPLGDEIEAIQNYLAIEMIRFESRLAVHVDVDPGLREVEIPSLLLHPLVENAVKHGMMAPGPLTVEVSARREAEALVISVSNTGGWRSPGSIVAPHGTGTGLRNVRARLARLGTDVGRLEIDERDGRVIARVRLAFGEPAQAMAPRPAAPQASPTAVAATPPPHDVAAPRPAGR